MGIHKHHSHRHTSSSTKHSRHHRHGESKSKHKHHTKKKHHHHHRHKHKKKSHHKKHRSTEPEVELESKILQDALDCLEASALTAIQAGNQLTPQALDAIVSSTLSKARRNGEEGEGGEGSEDSDTDTTLSSSEDEIGGSGGAEKKEFKVEMKNVPETKLERKSDQSSRQSAKTNVESSSSKISEYIGIEDRKRSESQSSSKNQLLDSHSSSKDDVDSCSSLKSHSSDSQSSSKDRTVSQSSSNSKNEMEFHSNKILSQSNSEISKIESQSTSGSKNFLSSSNRETQSSFGSKDATGSGSKEKAESQSIKDKMESDSKGKALSQSSSNLKDKEFFQSSSKDKAESDSESSSDDDSPISTKSIPSLANRASKIKIKIGKDLGDAKVERDENSSACCEQNMKQSVVSGSSKVTYVNLKAVSSDVQAKSRAGGTDSDAGGSRVIKKVHNESEGSAPGPKLKSKSPGSKLKSKSPDSNPDSNKEKASKKKKKRLQSRSRSRSRGRSRYCSRSRERSRRISRSKSRDSYNRSKKERSRSRSPYRHYSKSGRYSRSKHRSRSRSRSRKRNHRSHSRSRKRRSHRSRSSSSNSGSRSPARGKKLLKESAKPSEVVQSISAIAKGFSEVVKNKEKQNNISVLTNFCKSLQKKQKLEDELGPEVAAAAESASEETDYRVPFMVGPVPMYQTGYVYHNNTWKSANQIIAETNAANAALVAPRPLTDVFPVSTGIQHKKSSYLDEELPIAAAQKSSAVDISSLAIQRLQASERLKHNPTDFEALSTLATIENQTRQWAASKMIPGQYTGEQTLSPLTREDHKAGIQAWAKKKMFHDLAPVMSGFGMKMLKKMGWNEGRSLGKEGKGCLEPLAMDVKMDRTGLCTEMDKRPPVLQPSPALPTMMIAPTLVATDTKSAHLVQGKHPVSALQEICSKKRWDNPVYELVQAAGPAHNKTFHYQVTIPLGTFKSANASKNKKQAKMEAAAAALQGLGLVDRKQ